MNDNLTISLFQLYKLFPDAPAPTGEGEKP